MVALLYLCLTDEDSCRRRLGETKRKFLLAIMQPINSFLPSLLRRVSKDPDATLIFLQELWPQIVGHKFSGKITPVAFKNSVLTLAVADETWLKEGRYLGRAIRESINHYWGLPLVEKLRFELHQVESDQF